MRVPAGCLPSCTGIIFNVTGGSDMALYEVEQVASVVQSLADPACNIIFGAGAPRSAWHGAQRSAHGLWCSGRTHLV